jgi:hypothetical protein
MGVRGLPGENEVRAWVERTCQAQGLLVKIGEPRVTAAAVTLLRGEAPGQTRQIGATRPGSKRVRPRTAGPMIARSSTDATIAR